MDLLIYAVLGLALTWALYMTYIHVATRAAEGRTAEPLFRQFPELATTQGKVLVYCYSPQCGPCRPMSEQVDRLVASGAPVVKLDITAHFDLARELGIRATPTLILIADGVIERMVIGVKTADYMQGLIAAAAR